MAKKEKTTEARLAALYEQQKKYGRIQEKKKKYEKRLDREQNHSPFKKAAGLFFLPIKREGFATMLEWAGMMVMTILFAGCASLVGILILLAAIADLLYLLLYGVSYPILVLFYAVAHPFRMGRFRYMIASLDAEAKAFDIAKLRAEIAAQEKKLKKKEEATRKASSSDYVHVSDRVKETDWYKNKVDEEYRRLMGMPPKDTSLPSYATDVTLDMH